MSERWRLAWPSRAETSQFVGEAMKQTWRHAAAEEGVQVVARRLRRIRGFSGDPQLALKVLGIRPYMAAVQADLQPRRYGLSTAARKTSSGTSP